MTTAAKPQAIKRKRLAIGNDKGGVFKSGLTRGIAHAIPDCVIVEIDSAHRLLEYEHRTRFHRMRVDRALVEESGGSASRAEFDGVLNDLAGLSEPLVMDIGANTAVALLEELKRVGPSFAKLGIEVSVLTIVTADPSAITEAERCLRVADGLASKRFVIENRVLGPVDAGVLARLGKGATVTVMPKFEIDTEVWGIFGAGGFEAIDRLSDSKLTERFGFARADRIKRDLHRLRQQVLEVVEPASRWLIS